MPPRAAPHTSTLRSSSNSWLDSDSDSDHGPSPLSVQWKSDSELGHSSFQDQHLSNGRSAIKCPLLRQEKPASDLPKLANKRPMPVSVHTPARPTAIQSRSSSRPPGQNVPVPAKDIRGCISYPSTPDPHDCVFSAEEEACEA